MLAENGAYIVDSDQIVHQLLTPDTTLGRKIIELLGNEIVIDEKIDRAKVAKRVFLNPKQLHSLEELLHPSVYAEIEKRYAAICKAKNPPPFFVAEIPLLFETKAVNNFDKTILVTSNTELRLNRFQKSTGYEREDFNRRNARFLSEEEALSRADYVIENNGTLEDLHLKVNQLFDTLCNNATLCDEK